MFIGIIVVAVLLLLVVATAPAMAGNADTKTFGIKIFHGAAGATAATPLVGIREIMELPKKTFDEYEKTEVDQTGRNKQFVMTVYDGGNLGLRLGHSKTKVAAVNALADGEDRSWKIEYSDGSTDTFEGPVKVSGPEAGNANTPVTVVATIRVNSEVVFTPAA